jgi:replicative DNA helicase
LNKEGLMDPDVRLNRVLPHSLDAERSVLGAVLLDETLFNEAAELLSPDDFYREAHRRVFSRMSDLWERKRAIDLVTLTEELKDSGELDRVGGIAYVSSLVDGVPRLTNVTHYARIVKEKSLLRQLISASADVVENCYSQEKELDQLLTEAEQAIFRIAEGKIAGGFVGIKDIVKETFTHLEKLYEKKELITGFPTPFMRLNELTSGFQHGELIIVASRPAMGKTSFCLNIAQQLALSGDYTVGIFSLEMSKEQLVTRMLCSLARVDSHRLRTGFISAKEWNKLSLALGQLAECDIFVDDSATLSVIELRAKARKLLHERGVDMLIIDYLQLLRMPGRFENRNQEISAISRALKGLAKELSIPVVAVSQLSRDPEKRGRKPQLSDLRESGAIEQDADLVLLIYRAEEYNPTPENEGIADIIIAKQRNGPTDSFKLAFQKKYTRFDNLELRTE